MKVKIFFLLNFVFFLCQLISVYAQSFILYGDRTFGGNNGEIECNILYAGNNNLIIGGRSNTDISGDKTDSLCNTSYSDIWILKIGTAFNIIWQNDLGGDLADADPAINFSDNKTKIMFGCRSFSDSTCDKTEHNRDTVFFTSDYWIGMLDSNGNKMWDKTLGGLFSETEARIIQLTSGDYIVSGESSSPVGGDKTVTNYGGTDFWTIKLDSLGNKIWDKVYGGTLGEWATNNEFSVLACTGGDFILAGSTVSPVSGDVSDSSRGDWDIWIIKCDSAGNKIWDKRYGGSASDKVRHIEITNDNGYILCGYTSSPQSGDVSEPSRGGADCWVIKMDSLGNKQWDKRYGGNKGDFATQAKEAPEGGYWISGYTGSDSTFEVSEPSYGFSDFWMLKIDSAGNKLWDKRFGGPGSDIATSFVIMPDSSIFLFGWADSGTSAVKTDAGKGSFDYWLVHFKYGYNTVSVNEITNPNNLVTVFPNPAQDVLNINSSQNFTAAFFVLYDATGRRVMEQRINKTAILSVSQLQKGIYFYEVRDKAGRGVYGKVIKE